MRAIQSSYRQENVHYGEAVTSAVITGAQIFTPRAPVALVRTVRNVSHACEAARNRDALEEAAMQEGKDIHAGHRKRHIARGAVNAVISNI